MGKVKTIKKAISKGLKHNLLTYAICFFSLFFLQFSLFIISISASSGTEEIKIIQKAYENIKDIKGSFVQKSYIKDLKRTDTYKGEFFIKMPKKVKWEYKGETNQEVIINNDDILIYQKKEKQAFRGRFDKDTYGQAPIALLSGFGRIQEEFCVSEKNGRLILTPKKPMGNIVSIEIESSEDEFPISSFTINDSRSNRVEIELKDVKINTGLKDSLFELSLPESITIY
jgi:outer membrane lipoprotein carrier protein